VSDADAAAVGLGGFEHRRFPNEFFAGRFPGSFAAGAVFQENLVTGDARISGMAASLCGIESAVAAGDLAELTLALRRLEPLYAVVFSFGGIPLIYMGDELALPNDPGWADDPEQARDNRWMHRPRMDWARPARRADPASVEGRAFAALRGLARARQELLALRSGGTTEIPVTAQARGRGTPGAPGHPGEGATIPGPVTSARRREGRTGARLPAGGRSVLGRATRAASGARRGPDACSAG